MLVRLMLLRGQNLWNAGHISEMLVRGQNAGQIDAAQRVVSTTLQVAAKSELALMLVRGQKWTMSWISKD